MESNGSSSAGKCSRYLVIRYVFINDLKENGLVPIKYCPTEEMVADYMTKPLHGSNFTTFRNMITSLTNQQYFLSSSSKFPTAGMFWVIDH